MDYVFDINHGSTVIPDDYGAVAVIDGSKNLRSLVFNALVSLINLCRDFETDSAPIGRGTASDGP